MEVVFASDVACVSSFPGTKTDSAFESRSAVLYQSLGCGLSDVRNDERCPQETIDSADWIVGDADMYRADHNARRQTGPAEHIHAAGNGLRPACGDSERDCGCFQQSGHSVLSESHRARY